MNCQTEGDLGSPLNLQLVSEVKEVLVRTVPSNFVVLLTPGTLSPLIAAVCLFCICMEINLK